MQEYPHFSVLMSLYIKEKPDYFKECMESILAQSVLPDEILIVEDGPINDEVRVLLEEYKSRFPDTINTVSYEKNMGLGYALSVGIKACKYNLIARMDTDDVAKQDRFEKQLAEFMKDPELDICGSHIAEFEEIVSNIVAYRIVPISHQEIAEYQKRRDAFNHMTVMYKKEAVLDAGNYQTCPLMEDTYLWVRMLQHGAKCKNIDETLVYARIGDAMYERRGGLDYFNKYKDGRKQVKQTGYISNFDYYYTIAIQFAVAVMPQKIRGFVFKKMLHGRR